MNKRGQFGAENTNILKVLGAIVLVVLVVWGFYSFVSTTGKSATSIANQLPKEQSVISAACLAEANKPTNAIAGAFVTSAYCNDPRSISYPGTLGLFPIKAVVNCDYAKSKQWFDTSKITNPVDCSPSTVNSWAMNYCTTLKETKGDKYDDSLIVNGKRCGNTDKGVEGWGISKTGTASTTGTPTPAVPTAAVVKSCSELDGVLIANIADACPSEKEFKKDSGFTEASAGKFCCVAA